MYVCICVTVHVWMSQLEPSAEMKNVMPRPLIYLYWFWDNYLFMCVFVVVVPANSNLSAKWSLYGGNCFLFVGFERDWGSKKE